jgi:hypothetical protein
MLSERARMLHYKYTSCVVTKFADFIDKLSSNQLLKKDSVR